MANIDTHELDKLVADLGAGGAAIGPFAAKAVEVGARNLRDDWRSSAEGMPHAPAFPYSIDYEMVENEAFGGTEIRADIGPDKGKPQGALGNLIEYGSVNNAPQNLGQNALQREEADFNAGIDKAVEDTLRAAGF